jgi:hypothetical protein
VFDFFSTDEFTIALEIGLLLFIIYDLKHYLATKKREYLFNIVLALGFFIYTAIPFYNKYVTWEDGAKTTYMQTCLQEHNQTRCDCVSDEVFKEYSFETYDFLRSQRDDALNVFETKVHKTCQEE